MSLFRENRFIRHRDYIDHRIHRIASSFTAASCTPSHSVIEFIYGITPACPAIIDADAKEAATELREFFSGWDILSDGDLGGYILQALSSRDEKKYLGQFFTPPDIVRKMIEQIPCPDRPIDQWKILDPSCGSGQFLIHFFKALLTRYTNLGYSRAESARLIIRKNLFGIDIDQRTVAVARLNLARISGLEPDEINILCHDFLFRDDLKTGEGIITTGFYDIIIGNPPWGSRLSAEQKKYYRKTYIASQTGINTFTLFIERSFNFLRKDGNLAFLIPEAYLNIKAHRGSRKFVLETSRISAITLWGEQFHGVFAPAISLFLQREENDANREKNIVEVHNHAGNKTGAVTLVPQASFLRNTENIFSVNYSRKAVDILETVNNTRCTYLRDSSTFFLGVVTGDNNAHILPFPEETHPDPIIVGRDLSQYRINFSNHYFKSEADLQQVAPRHLYHAKNKLLYRFIGKKLTFALDREGYYMLNNVNGIIPRIDNLSVESILSLLNSRVLQYYYEKTFFTVKVLRGNIEHLPLRNMSEKTQKRIEKLISSIMESNDTAGCRERENLEDILFHEYGLKDAQAHYISDYLRGAGVEDDTEANTTYKSTTSSLPSSAKAIPFSG